MQTRTLTRKATRAVLTICVALGWVFGGAAEARPSSLPVLRVIGATGSASLRDATIYFDKRIDPGAASDLFYYRCVELGEPLSATPNPDGTSVTVRFSNPQVPGSRYTVNVSNMVGLIGELQDPPSVDVIFNAFVLKQGFLQLSIYDGLGEGVVGPPPFGLPPPSAEFLIPAFDTRSVLPTDSRENYLGRIDGFFVPPTSGNWVFYLGSDDSSELWIDLDDGYGPVKVMEEPDCCGTFEQTVSAPLALTIGKPYRMIGIYRERSGADYMQVAAKLESDPTPPNQLQPIAGAMIGIYAEETNQPPLARITADALVDISPDFEHPVLISCNWWNACLKLDASRSSDPVGESLEFAWFADDDTVPFSDASPTMPCFEVGIHEVMLVVTDSTGASSTDRAMFEVIAAPLAVELLLEEVNQSNVSRPTKRQLVALLRAALVESRRNGGRPDQRTLNALERKVRFDIAARWPDAAEAWIRWSQAIKHGMEKCVKQSKPKPFPGIK